MENNYINDDNNQSNVGLVRKTSILMIIKTRAAYPYAAQIANNTIHILLINK